MKSFWWFIYLLNLFIDSFIHLSIQIDFVEE